MPTESNNVSIIISIFNNFINSLNSTSQLEGPQYLYPKIWSCKNVVPKIMVTEMLVTNFYFLVSDNFSKLFSHDAPSTSYSRTGTTKLCSLHSVVRKNKNYGRRTYYQYVMFESVLNHPRGPSSQQTPPQTFNSDFGTSTFCTL